MLSATGPLKSADCLNDKRDEAELGSSKAAIRVAIDDRAVSTPEGTSLGCIVRTERARLSVAFIFSAEDFEDSSSSATVLRCEDG